MKEKDYDGHAAIVELLIGSLLSVAVGIFLAARTLPSESGLPIRMFLAFGLPFLAVASGVVIVKGLCVLRDTIVLPRSEPMAAGHSPVASRRLQIGSRVLGTAGIAAFCIGYRQWEGLLAFVLAMGIAVIYILLGLIGLKARWPKAWLPEMFCFGVISAIFGIWEYLTGGRLEDQRWFLVWLGAATVVAGLLRLLSFLKSHPDAGQAASRPAPSHS